MMQQEEQMVNFMKEKKIAKMPCLLATKFTIDSVINNKFRLLISKSKEPILRRQELFESKGFLGKQLAKFDFWEDSEEQIILLEETPSKIGIRKDQIK